MYSPIQIGIQTKFRKQISYVEIASQKHVEIVFCYWFLSSNRKLTEDFEYLVLPDGCIDIIFDVSKAPEFRGALLMTPKTSAEVVTLGREFSYVGIRLRPGTWVHSPVDIVGKQEVIKVISELSLEQIQTELSEGLQSKRIEILEQCIASLKQRKVVGANHALCSLLERAHQHFRVDDYISSLRCSRRHVQRLFKSSLGYSPHDFLKIIRFQKCLAQNTRVHYADQSHYIRDFKRVTGMTPVEFQKRYY